MLLPARYVTAAPAITKKNRPAHWVVALCEDAARDAVETCLLTELPTLGLRRQRVDRRTLPRRVEERDTPLGRVRFKVRTLPGGEELGFFQERQRSFQTLDGVPMLELGASGDGAVYRADYVEFPGQNRNLGEVQGNLHLLATGGLTLVRTTFAGSSFKALSDLDVEGDVVLLLSERDAFLLERLGLDGMLVISSNERNLARRYTLSPRDPRWTVFGTGRERGQFTPMLWISEGTASDLLAQAGYDHPAVTVVDDANGLAERVTDQVR